MNKEPRWVPVFLKQLERTGNVRLAAEGAGVDYTTAYQRRKRHGEFAEAWAASLRNFAEAPARPVLPPPAAAVSFFEGEKGLIIRPSKGGSGALVSAPHVLTSPRWGKRAEEAFLTELTVTANVRIAARAAGFSTAAVYKRRMKDKHFAAAWEAAIETGKARVQAYLVEAATRTFDPDELPIGDERDMPKVSISEAINIAKMKGPSTSLGTNGFEEEVDEDQFKEVRERIIDKLQRLKERDQRELGEAGWAEWEVPPRPDCEKGETVWLPPGYRLVGPEA